MAQTFSYVTTPDQSMVILQIIEQSAMSVFQLALSRTYAGIHAYPGIIIQIYFGSQDSVAEVWFISNNTITN